MNLRLIKNADNIENSVLLGNDKFLVKEFLESEYDTIRQVKYFIYDLVVNEKYEILPSAYKLDVFRIKNSIPRGDYVYLCEYIEADSVFNLIKYNYETKEINILYTFSENIEEYYMNKKITFFILNDMNILIQTEKLRRNLSDNYEGYFDFKLTFYKVKEEKGYTVVDENLINNGISDIISITDSLYAIKTGYSLLVDNRYEILDKFEVSVESVSIVNIQQLISDLVISQNSIVMDNIDQAYYKQTIPYIKVEDGFLIHSKIDNETNEEKISYYNIQDKTVISCINKGVTSENKLAQPLVINNKPYIRLNKSKKTDFLNLKTKKVDLTFPLNKVIEDVNNDIFIITEAKKGLFNTTKKYISVYKYPSMAVLHSEKGEYQGSLYGDDTLYLFTD